MDSCSKSGRVYLQPRKAGKKWKPVWLTLVPHSSNTVGRIEIHEVAEAAAELGLRRHQALGERKAKVVRLSELLNVLRLPPNAEACPMENMCAFCVETQERTLVFAALKDDCAEWVDKLCVNSFQKNNLSVWSEPQMEENALYASADDVSDFAVLVQRTDAAARCGLQGAYRLHVGRESLQLRDAQRNTVQEFRYELLRRYGKDKDCLTIETGRRCDCGPGTLVFQTSQSNTIFSLIQSTIKRKTTHTAPPGGLETEKHDTLNPRAASPRPRTPDLTAMIENQLRTRDETEEKATSPHPAPITLMPLPSVPKQQTIPKSVADNVYADPADCVIIPEVGTSLYVDPASVLPLKPPRNGDSSLGKEHPVYAEVFDKVTEQKSTAKVERFTEDEPIYSEPVREAEEDKREEEVEKKPDPFAHLYAQVCKTPKKAHPQEVKTDPDSDIIYENLGII